MTRNPILSVRSSSSGAGGLWRGGVGAGADGMASHFGEQLELPLQRADVDRGAKRAEIVVVAYPIQLDVFAVEKESAVWIEPDRTDAESRVVHIDHVRALPHRRHRHVPVWSLM